MKKKDAPVECDVGHLPVQPAEGRAQVPLSAIAGQLADPQTVDRQILSLAADARWSARARRALVLLQGRVRARRDPVEALDQELKNRPYQAYSLEDLEKLTSAYQGQMDGLQARLARTGCDNTRIMDGYAPADFDGKVKAFEQFLGTIKIEK